MKILVTLNTHVDSHSVSGVMKLLAVTAKGWLEQGHRVDFLLGRATFPALNQLVPGAGLISSDNIFNLTRLVDKTWLYFLPYAWRLVTCHFTRFSEKYDVVYASSHFIVEAYPAKVIAHRLGARLAVKIPHVLTSQINRQSFFDRLFIAAEKWSARLTHEHAAAITCLTSPVARDYADLEKRCGVPVSETTVVGCGIELEALTKLNAASKEFDVVFLARMHEKKGVFELPKLWQLVREKHPLARLVVIGEGPHRRRCAEMFEQLGLGSSVVFTGGISEDQKNALLSRSKIGLSLSYEEGWGLSITEFMAAGLPVVSYHLPVFDEIFGDHLLLAKPGNFERAAESLCRLLEDDDLRQKRGQAARAFIQRYDYRRVAQLEIEVLSRSERQSLTGAGPHSR